MVDIIQETETSHVAGTLLGQRVAAPDQYSPSILVKVPRSDNRIEYGIDDTSFVGFDVWNAYEISFQLDNGIPLSFVGKLIYPSWTTHIVESKSLKLYFNSFNMEKLGSTITLARARFIAIVRKDLSELFEVDVHNVQLQLFAPFDDLVFEDDDHLFVPDLYDLVDVANLAPVETFSENPDYLEDGIQNEFEIQCNVWRTNCRITAQPDYATVLIKFKGTQGLSFESLVRYIASFRGMCRFHEEAMELLFKRLQERFNPDDLCVIGLYTRRGGIDIVPIRATNADLIPYGIINISTPLGKTLHQ